MPIYKARLNRDPGGAWVASSVELPNCWSRGSTREEALAKLRDEIRYRIEYCPCSGVDEEFVRVELQVSPQLGTGTPPAEQPAAPAPGRTTPPPNATRREWPAARPTTPAALSGVAGCPPAAREPSQPGASRPAPGPSAPEPAPGSRPAGWRRWDD
jgi:hypothetical protein